MSTSPFASLQSFGRQFAAPSKQIAQEYGADHRNDFSKKIVYCKDVCNSIIDILEQLLSELGIINSNPCQISRTDIEQRNMSNKLLDLRRLDNEILETMGRHLNDSTFELTWGFGNDFAGGERMVRFSQAKKNDRNKYVKVEAFLVRGEGNSKREKKIDSIVFHGTTFLDIYRDVQSMVA